VTARTVAAVATLAAAAYLIAPRADVGPHLITTDGCAIVEHGPTGPEPDVTLGRTVERCADGTYVTTTWRLATGEVVDVDHHDGHVTDREAADLAGRLATIRAERSGVRWSR
jgi:hypothetical protein